MLDSTAKASDSDLRALLWELERRRKVERSIDAVIKNHVFYIKGIHARTGQDEVYEYVCKKLDVTLSNWMRKTIKERMIKHRFRPQIYRGNLYFRNALLDT